jgi:hypothetical protein
MASILRQQRQEIKDQLEAIPFFDVVNIVTEDAKDIDAEISKALGTLTEKGGKMGVVVILLTARAKMDGRGEFGPVFSEIVHLLRVLEDPMVNRDVNGTGKVSTEVAEQICAALNGFKPVTANGPLIAHDDLKPADDPNYPGHDVAFVTSGSLDIELPQIDTPEIEDTAGTISMSCGTDGAAIFYTTDGKKPAPRTGTLYLAPFEPGPGVTVKARAWLAGFLASEIEVLQT